MLPLLSEIYTEVWAITAQGAAGYMPSIVRMIKGENASLEELKEARRANQQATRPKFALLSKRGTATEFDIMWDDEKSLDNLPDEGAHAIISVDGVIQRSGGFCSKGSLDIMKELDIVGRHPKIKGVMLKVHSPGGSVSGTEDFANMVASFEDIYKKPLAAYISNSAYSAGYWIVSGAKKIFISGKTAAAGSIGTMSTIYDDTKMLEDMGVKEIVTRATKSFNKNQAFYDALNGNPETLKKELLDPINEAFLGAVRKGRRGKLNTSKTEDGVPVVLTGKEYIGQEIIDMGLADEMGTTDDVIKYLDAEAKAMKAPKAVIVAGTSLTSKSTHTMSLKDQFLALFKKANMTATKDGEPMSEEEFAAALENLSIEFDASIVEGIMAKYTESEGFVAKVKALAPEAAAPGIDTEQLTAAIAEAVKPLETTIATLKTNLEQTSKALADMKAGRKAEGKEGNGGSPIPESASNGTEADDQYTAEVAWANKMFSTGNLTSKRRDELIASAQASLEARKGKGK